MHTFQLVLTVLLSWTHFFAPLRRLTAQNTTWFLPVPFWLRQSIATSRSSYLLWRHSLCVSHCRGVGRGSLLPRYGCTRSRLGRAPTHNWLRRPCQSCCSITPPHTNSTPRPGTGTRVHLVSALLSSLNECNDNKRWRCTTFQISFCAPFWIWTKNIPRDAKWFLQIPGLPMHPAAMQAAVPHVPHLSAASSSMIGTPVAANSAGPTTPVSSAAANAPCSTLFVANLGPFCSEQELKDLFGR